MHAAKDSAQIFGKDQIVPAAFELLLCPFSLFPFEALTASLAGDQVQGKGDIHVVTEPVAQQRLLILIALVRLPRTAAKASNPHYLERLSAPGGQGRFQVMFRHRIVLIKRVSKA